MMKNKKGISTVSIFFILVFVVGVSVLINTYLERHIKNEEYETNWECIEQRDTKEVNITQVNCDIKNLRGIEVQINNDAYRNGYNYWSNENATISCFDKKIGNVLHFDVQTIEETKIYREPQYYNDRIMNMSFSGDFTLPETDCFENCNIHKEYKKKCVKWRKIKELKGDQ